MNRPSSYVYTPRETTTILPTDVRRGFVFAPLYRSENKLADAHTFQSRARQFCVYYGLQQPMFFDNDGDNDEQHFADGQGLVARRASIITALNASPRPLDVVAYFGHGLRRGLSSAGFLGTVGLREFANALVQNASRRLVVVLNACSTGYPGGFAEQLCSELIGRGVHATVFAHDTSGHTTNNPAKRRYPGGDYLIDPSDSYYAAWRTKLWETDLWSRYPFMEPDELNRVLRS